MRTVWVPGVGAVLALTAALIAPANAGDATDIRPPDAATDSYIVTTWPSTDAVAEVGDVAPDAPVVDVSGPAFTGVVSELTPTEAAEVAAAPGVVAVEPERRLTAAVERRAATRRSLLRAGDFRSAGVAATWGLDRTDQRGLPLDQRYEPRASGRGVHVYVIDSGLADDHPDFAGRIGPGAFAIGTSTDDCYGHGTHVAGIIASSRYGMAPEAVVHPVRVLDCAGGGSTRTILAGLNWVAANAPRHAIVNLSLRGKHSVALDAAVGALVRSGRVVVTAAGNDARPACNYSPGGAPEVLTVGAVNAQDREAAFSNYGRCVDLYAPGVGIRSTAVHGGAGRVLSGTSMAAPHVSGAAAVLWSAEPGASGRQIRRQLVQQATTDTVKFVRGRSGSADRVLYNAPARTPGAPRAVVARAGDDSVVVSWRAAASNTADTLYTVTTTPRAGRCQVVNTTRCRITGLEPATKYSFRVRALNIAGKGPVVESAAVRPN